MIASLALCLLASGCTPPGPKALLEGKHLIDDGRHADAVPRLQKAVELLPTNALAWNYLGLAYHLNGQAEQAFKAYQTALSIDHRMAALHFNLGCLYLERNNLSGAIEELKAFTLLQPATTEGWLKLGQAFQQARRLDEAEKAYRSALELHRSHPEALNGLGMIQIQRRKWQDAIQNFAAASAANTNYAPAFLNAAVVQHQYLNNRKAALANYRRYLALNPSDSEVLSVINHLDADLNPPAAAKPSVDIVSQLTPRTNASSSAPASASRVRTNLAPTTALAGASPKPTASSGKPAATNSDTIPAVPLKVTPARPTEPAAVVNAPNSARSTALIASNVRPAELQAAKVEEQLILRPAQELRRFPAAAGHSDPVTDSPSNSSSLVSNEPTAKRTLLSRLNPFSRPGKSNSPANSPDGEYGASPAVGARPERLPELATPPQVRYDYLSPALPSRGNRDEAIAAFKRAIKAQKAGDRTKSVAEYQSAIRLDPAYFDAYYNLGLVAIDSGDVRLSLWAGELSLVLQPESIDARYNFAIALKSAGYPQDAAFQLDQIIQAKPGEVKAHLALGNLFAQQLKQPKQAREHYLRVLDLSAKHPEAPTIRYWLAANP